RTATQLAHDVVGAHALGQPEAAAGARDGVVHVLAQDDPPALELDLEQRALGQPQRVAHRLGQGDLAALGNGGFHGVLLPGRAWLERYAAIIHTLEYIPKPTYREHGGNAFIRTLGVCPPPSHPHKEPQPWPIPSPPATASRSTARPTPTPASRSSAASSTSRACPTR